jgi:RNA polymerase sigma-70 factor (ECF subfamily)
MAKNTATWVEEYNMINAIAGGDKSQYLELVRRYQRTIFELLCRITNSQSEAEELTRKVFVKAYKNLNKFNFKRKFESWIYVMALYMGIDFMFEKNSVEEPADSMYTLPEENPEQFHARSGQRLLLRKAIATLNKKQYAVLVLKYFEDLSYEEIGKELGISEKKVKSRIYKTRELLRDKLTPWNYYEKE